MELHHLIMLQYNIPPGIGDDYNQNNNNKSKLEGNEYHHRHHQTSVILIENA